MTWPAGTRVEAICDLKGEDYLIPKGSLGTASGNEVDGIGLRLGMNFTLYVDGDPLEQCSYSYWWRPLRDQGGFGNQQETMKSLIWAKEPAKV